MISNIKRIGLTFSKLVELVVGVIFFVQIVKFKIFSNKKKILFKYYLNHIYRGFFLTFS